MKKVLTVTLILAFGFLSFAGGLFYPEIVKLQKKIREAKITVREKKEEQKAEKADEGALLQEADKLAKECLERICVAESERMEKYVGIVYGPTEKPNYADIILQLHYKQFMPQDVYNLVGSECGVPVIYILQNLENWKKLQNYPQTYTKGNE